MFLSKKFLSNFLISISLSIIIYFFITQQIIYPTIPPMIKNGASHLFADWSVILSANICQSKFDVFTTNPCDAFNRTHVYGSILLNIPFIKDFSKFYLIIFPSILNFLFIYVIVSFFKFKNYLEYLTLLPFIFSIPVLLVIERANIDILIFLILVLTAFNKKIVYNYLSIIFVSLLKFYPICLAIIFLFEKNYKKILLYSFIFVLIISALLFFEFSNIKKIFTVGSDFSASHHLSFSLKGFIDHNNELLIAFNNKDYNWIKYLYIMLILVIPLTITVTLNLKRIFNNNDINLLFFTNSYENRLFILSITVVLSCYFAFDNYLYREIFFIGFLPWLIKEKNSGINNKFINFLFYILCFKFFLTSVLIYLYRNHLTLLKPLATITKQCLDFYVVFIFLLVFISAIYKFFKEQKKLKFINL